MRIHKRPFKRDQGFLLFSVVILFFVLTVLCGFVLAAFARANDQLFMTVKYHQLEQAALSSMEVLKVEVEERGCHDAPKTIEPLGLFNGIEVRATCTFSGDYHDTLQVMAVVAEDTQTPLQAGYELQVPHKSF